MGVYLPDVILLQILDELLLVSALATVHADYRPSSFEDLFAGRANSPSTTLQRIEIDLSRIYSRL